MLKFRGRNILETFLFGSFHTMTYLYVANLLQQNESLLEPTQITYTTIDPKQFTAINLHLE